MDGARRGEGRRATRPCIKDVFDRIAFGRGEAPGASAGAAAAIGATSDAAPATTTGATLDDFVVQGTTGGMLGAGDFLRVHPATPKRASRRRGLFEDRGALAILFIVFVGGLALNLTPCVLPMIPINLAIIGAGAQAGSRGRGSLLGATYGAAMAAVYGVLGVVVILTAGHVRHDQLEPLVQPGIAVLFVVLALAMFDVIVIDFSRFSSSFNVGSTGRGTFLVAFAMGAVAALLAGACVAPDRHSGGRACEQPLRDRHTGRARAPLRPRPGHGAAVADRRRRHRRASDDPARGWCASSRPSASSSWRRRCTTATRRTASSTNRWVDPAEVSASVEEQLKAGWHASLDEGLALAARENKPVLIDMWATLVQELSRHGRDDAEGSAVTSALSNYVKIKFQAESPDESPAKEVMSRFGAVGLPTYVILRHK